MASRIKTISMSVILLIVLLFVGCGNQTNSANENDSLNITEEQIELKKIEEEILDKNKEQDCSVSNITITDIDGDKYTVSYTIQKGRGSDVAKINVTNSIFKKISEYFILIDRGDYDVRSVGSGSNSGTTNSSVQKTSSKVIVSNDILEKIEDALQYYSEIMGNPKCNVFHVIVTENTRNYYKVSYSLRSTWSNGKKTLVKFEGAKVSNDGKYTVLDGGYN